MKLTIFIFWFLILILSPHGLFSKSITNKEYSSDSENFNAKTDVDRLGSDDYVALHDNYRPRHKYKAVTGHQARFNRNDPEFDKESENKNPQCAVMYKNNEPVGILQPFEDSYRFLPLNGEPTLVDINPIPVKRKTIMDVLYPSKVADEYDDEIVDNNEQFTDDRYPSIFAKFKIDSRLDKSLNPDVHMKRTMNKRKSEKTDLNEDQVGSLKSTLTKMKSDDSVAVEEELKNILDDMGLIDDYPDKEEAKREAEDENLELGTNKINLVKEERKEKRDKRNEGTSTTSTASSRKYFSQSSTDIAPKEVQFLETQTEEAESIDLFNPNDAAKIEDESENADLEVSTEKAEELRKRRQYEDSVTDKHTINSFGDFTTPNLVEEGELNEYEKRVEREIREKIEKLKDEVKKEINDLKQSDADKNKKSLSDTDLDPRRRKRQVANTLMDEESVDIDPTLHTDGQNSVHIRRKKSADFEGKQVQDYEPQMYNNTLKHDSKYIANNTTIIEDSNTCVSPKTTISGANNSVHKVIVRRFIGINPILKNGNYTKHQFRALKQYNVDTNKEDMEDKPHIRVKREQIGNENINIPRLSEAKTVNSTNIRKKRQTREEMDDNAYQYDDSQFNEEIPYENQNNNNNGNMNENANMEAERMENSQQITDNSKACNCDKNGNNCKCGHQNIDLRMPDFKQEYSDYIINPSNSLEKKSIINHCKCGKNENHCKCGHISDDGSQTFNHEDSDYIENQSSAVETKSENLNDKEPLKEYPSDSKIDVPSRVSQRRRSILDPIEKSLNEEANHGAEQEYDDYDTGENSLVKRDAKPRKVSVNEPFQNGEYFVDLHPDVYKLSPVDNSREKRANFNELIALHGGGPVRSHLVAIKQRSMMPHTRFRRRVQNDDNRELRQLIDMTDEELFGALPQSFEGELARYKRVKRAKAKK